MRRLLLAAVLPAALWGQAMPLPPAHTVPGAPAPAKKPAAAAPATAKEAAFSPLRGVELPKPAASQLASGLKIRLVEDHELPMLQGYVMVRTGSAFDPADRAGLARLTIDLLRVGGTRGKRPDAVEQEIDRLGARVDASSSETTCRLTFSVPRDGGAALLALIAEMVTEPAFRVEKLEVAKVALRSSVARGDENTGSAAFHRLTSFLYGADSPYGRQESEADFARMRQSDVSAFYRRYYVPANTVVAVQGDFDAAAMQASLEKLFGGWSTPQTAPVEAPKAAAAPAGIYLFPAKDLRRVSFAIGQLGGELRDADSAAWEVLANVLGGSRRSRLLQQVHTPITGDSLELIAQWVPKYDHAGILTITGFCGEPAFSTVLEGIENEVKRLRTAAVTEDELRLAKDTALARLAEGADTKAKRLAQALNWEIVGYPAGFTAKYEAALLAVTRADVERLAKTLDPARFSMVAIGDVEDIRRQLAPLNRSVTAATPPVPTKPDAAPPDAEAVERGRQLMARAQQASGGVDKVAALKDATRVALFDVGVLGGGSGRQTITERWVAPSDFREETSISAFAAYTNGQGGWLSDGVRSTALVGVPYEQVHAELFRLYPRLLLGDRIPGRTVAAADGDTVEIREGKRTVRVVFDDNGLPAELLYESASTAGTPIAGEEVFEDFRVVGGVKMPFRIRILNNGQPAAVVTVQDLKVNSGLKVEDLTKPR